MAFLEVINYMMDSAIMQIALERILSHVPKWLSGRIYPTARIESDI